MIISTNELHNKINYLAGGREPSALWSSRFIIGTWWFFCIAIMAIYSGNLVAFLTATKNKPPFSTLEGLIKDNRYEITCIGNSGTIEVLKVSKMFSTVVHF